MREIEIFGGRSVEENRTVTLLDLDVISFVCIVCLIGFCNASEKLRLQPSCCLSCNLLFPQGPVLR